MKIFIIAIVGLILLGIFMSIMDQPSTATVTTSKTVVVKQPVQNNYRASPPPPMYNPYKSQYYN